MDIEELKALEKEVNKLKFKASQCASELHDLVEDRLLSDWESIPKIADSTFQACKLWAEKNKEFQAAK